MSRIYYENYFSFRENRLCQVVERRMRYQLHQNMSDDKYFHVVIKMKKVIFWSSVDVSYYWTFVGADETGGELYVEAVKKINENITLFSETNFLDIDKLLRVGNLRFWTEPK